MVDHSTFELVLPWNWALGDGGVGRWWSCPVWKSPRWVAKWMLRMKNTALSVLNKF